MNESASQVCNYAVLKFLPYPETGEFVNLGVVVHCPGRTWMDAKVERGNPQRVMDFFPELNPLAFQTARETIVNELSRVRQLIGKTGDPELGRRIFRDLVRPRESVFRFGESRTILTQDVNGLAENLFELYVSRSRLQPADFPSGKTSPAPLTT
jgi:hypothetical protein